MKSILFLSLVFIIIKNVLSAVRGRDSSLVLLSNVGQPFNYDRISNLVVFGDSMSSTGTNFTTMGYSGYNLSGGKNWPLQLITLHRMNLWNFAVSGAVVDFKLVPRKRFKVSFLDESQMFIDKILNNPSYDYKWNEHNTITSFWLGCNDIRYLNRTKEAIEYSNMILTEVIHKKYDTIITTMFNAIKRMINYGIKNFLILNVPPLEKFPIKGDPFYRFFYDDTRYVNNLININAKKLYEDHPFINIIVYNIKEEYEYIMENYKKFNLTNADSPWRGKESQYDLKYFFWVDDYHLSYRGNEIIAEDINALLNSL